MKYLTLYVSAFLMILLTACGANNTLPKAQVEALMNAQEFTFMAERANPTNYDVVNVMNSFPGGSTSKMLDLDYGYTVQIKRNELAVELPYFGRMYTPSMDPSKNSYRFTSKDFSLTKADGRNGSAIFTVIPRDEKTVQRMIIEVFPQGRAYMSIASNDRQPISYHGYVMENKVQK